MPILATLADYLRAFAALNRGHAHGTKEKAPHKPVLLLAVLDEVEAGGILENRIYITPELVARFRDNWSRYVSSTAFSPDFTKPFFHLKGEWFWHLSMQPGREALLTASGSPKSFTALKASVLYAWLNDALFLLMQDALSREALLAAYFGGAGRGGAGYISEVEGQMLHEAPAQYRQQAIAFDEEEVAGRQGVFKRRYPGFIITPAASAGCG